METFQAQLNSCLHFVTDSLKTGSQGKVLKMKTTIVKQVKELTTPFQPHLLKPNAEFDKHFQHHPILLSNASKQYGKINSLGSPYLSRCHDTGKSLEARLQWWGRSLQLSFMLSTIM